MARPNAGSGFNLRSVWCFLRRHHSMEDLVTDFASRCRLCGHWTYGGE